MNSNRTFLLMLVISMVLIIFGRTKPGERFQLASSRIISKLSSPVNIFISIKDARRENAILRRQLMELTLKKNRLTSYFEENKRLKELLSFKEESPYSLIPAEVIAISSFRDEGIILINKGLEDGLKTGMVCITINGLLGITKFIEKDVSFIQTIYNPAFRASGMDSHTRAVGIIRHKNGLIIDNIPIGSELSLGDTVITSGLGEVFPKGLSVGRIKEIRKSENMLFYVAKLEPFSPPILEFVFIVKEEKTEEELGIPPPRKKVKRSIVSKPVFPDVKIRE